MNDLIEREAARKAICERCENYSTVFKKCKLSGGWCKVFSLYDVPVVNRCIPVEDGLPDTNGEYLVYTDHYEIVEYDTELQQFGHTDEYKDELGYNIVEWYEVYNVTHWMPIPEPPKKEVIP